MPKFTLSKMKPYSHWLAFTTSFLIVTTTISLTLLWPPGSVTSGNEATLGSPFYAWGDYQSPQHCRECHEAEFQAWSHTSHAEALFDPIFQVYLQQVEKPGECFVCHATGYDTTTGQFVLAGVTCEACHGPYRAEHPQESMIIATSAEMCGSCHPSTLVEWKSSQHGLVGVTCIDCHEVHTQQTRAAATTNALCATCHKNQIQDYTHVLHSEVDVHCIDCHLARPSNDGSRAISGHAVTGHSFAVFVKTCADCHPNSLISE
jgi:formate-dependent nitrite reductase cytochrome c552 subunit